MSVQTSVGAIVPPNGRGCGHRSHGIYAECGLSANGEPIENMLVDPPVRVDEKALGLSSIGVKLIEVEGVYHIFDIIGEQFYPNVADFVEEARRFGVSRKLNLTKDQYAKLTWESRLVLLHRRAWVGRYGVYADQWETTGEYERVSYNPCVKTPAIHSLESMPIVDRGPLGTIDQIGVGDSIVPDECCSGIWWQDVEGGKRDSEATRRVVREMPSFSYDAVCPPEGLTNRGYELAILGRFPISRLVIIDGASKEKMEKITELTADCQIPVDMVNE